MIIRVSQHSLDPLYRLHMEFASQHGREGMPTGEQVVTGIVQGATVGLLLDDQQGYALFHLADYNGVRVVWVDELYLAPAARKQGRLKEFAEWLKEYCRFNGIATIMGTAFTAAEGEPFLKHLGAEPVCMILRVNAPTMEYRSTQQKSAVSTVNGTVPVWTGDDLSPKEPQDMPLLGKLKKPRQRRNLPKYETEVQQ